MPQLLNLKEAPKIGLEEAKAEYDRGDALFVDVRSREAYDNCHIPRAISVPLMQIPQRAEELPRDRLIIFY